MKLLTAICALILSTGALAGEKTIWSANVHVNVANVWVSTGWQPVHNGGVFTNLLVIRGGGTYCDLRVADPLQYRNVRGGNTFYAHYNAQLGGYVVNEGHLAELSFNVYQNYYANVNCALSVNAIVDGTDDDSGGFNYQDADQTANMLALSALNLNLLMGQHGADYDEVKGLIEALENDAQNFRDKVADHLPYAQLERSFERVKATYNAFTDVFIPGHADIKNEYLELRRYYRALRAMFTTAPSTPVPSTTLIL